MTEAELLLPEGSVLLHIGPYKTGSTALQASFHRSRDVLARHGVRYAGSGTRPMRAGWGLIGRTPRGRRRATEQDWRRLVAEVRAAPEQRVVVSTEDFGRIGADLARRVVDDLGADRLRVVAVVRRLDRLLPSQWQQRAQSFHTPTYEEYLHAVLDAAPGAGSDPDHRAFWASHDVAAQAGRWAGLLPAGRVLLLVADEADRGLLPGTFERLLGLPAGALAPDQRSNPSLSLNGIELLRRVNLAFEQHGWSDGDYRRLVQEGMVRSLKAAPRTDLDVAIPRLPRWAADRVADLSASRADAVAALAKAGAVRLVGDPDALRAVDAHDAPESAPPPEAIGVDATVHALTGVIERVVEQHAAAQRRQRRQRERLQRRAGAPVGRPAGTRGGPAGAPVGRAPVPQDRRPGEPSGRELARELGRRVAARLPGRTGGRR